MENTKPHQFLTCIDQSKYHNNEQWCSTHGMVGPSFGKKTAVFDEKYQTSPIPTIIDQSKYHHNKQWCSTHGMVEPSFGEKTAVFDEKYQTSPIPNIH